MTDYRYAIDGIADTVREALKDARHQIITRETLSHILANAAQRVLVERPEQPPSLFTTEYHVHLD